MQDEKSKREATSQSGCGRQLIIIGIVIAYGLLTRQIFMGNREMGWSPVSISFLFITPLVIGGLSTMLFGENKSIIRSVANALGIGILFLISAVLFVSELWICVLMASPLVIIALVIGTVAMWIFRKVTAYTQGKKKKKRTYVFIGFLLLLPYAVAPIEGNMTPESAIYEIHDQIILDSPPEIIWQNIIRMETITEQRPSLFHLAGIPRPLRATLDYEGLGGLRIGEFEYGLTFEEEITVWQPNQRISFSIEVNHTDVDTPALLQIGGQYLDLLEAAYVIEPLDNGQTILHLSSKYRLSTTFNGYASIWADLIMHDFQNYVLNVVQQRTEAQ